MNSQIKVLLTHRPGGAYGFISEAWKNALRSVGVTAERWDGHSSSWHTFDPDLYIGCSGHKQPIPQNRKSRTAIAIHVNPYGSESIPGIDEAPETIGWVKQQDPTVVFGYGDMSVFKYWSKWESELRTKFVPMPTAGDAVEFSDLKLPRDNDVVYVGGYWKYKSQNLNKYLLPLLEAVSSKSVGVYGWGDWPIVGVHSGLQDGMVSKVFNSAKICPCIVEPHTVTYGIDLPERMFKVILCGAVAVHDYFVGHENFVKSVPACVEPTQYIRSVIDLINNDDLRDDIASRQKSEVLAAHTYHHRLAGMANKIFEVSGNSKFSDLCKLLLDWKQ